MDSSHEDRLFGLWLRRRRRALDLTQKRLASLLGCSVATIRKLEREERRPSRGLAAAIARTLGVPQDDLASFVRFARTGWADAPPSAADPELERPWAGTTPPRFLSDRDTGEGVKAPIHDHDAPDAPRPEPLATVVGRDPELAHLDEALRSALQGSGRVVLVSGEAGQGKTALLASFAARAQRAHPELLVAAGNCNAFSGLGDPFLPFREVLRQLTGTASTAPNPIAADPLVSERLDHFAQQGAAIVLEHGPRLLGTLLDASALRAPPASTGLVDGAPENGSREGYRMQLELGSGGVQQQALRSETVEVLERVTDTAPLLLALDDLQWADTSSLELLLQLAGVATRHRLLVTGALRPTAKVAAGGGNDPMAASLHELERRLGDIVLDLDRSDGRAFLRAWLDREPNRLDDAFRDALYGQTHGHPLFTIELLRAMQERGDLAKDTEGRWSAPSTLHWDALPARIAGALAERVDRLDEGARRVLQVASVEGETFTAEVVARVLGRDPRTTVQSVAADLASHHHLVESSGVQRTGTGLLSQYRFRHNLIQRFVYERLDEGQRTYLHEAVADALAELNAGATDPAALALHYTEARAPDRAAPFQRRAGDRSRASGALPEAIRYYQAALDGWDPSDSGGLTELRGALGECLQIRGERDRAKSLLEQAREGFLGAGDRRRAALAQVEIARATHDFGEPQAALAACRDALDLVQDEPECWERAHVMSAMCMFHGFAYDHDSAIAWGQRALAMARRVQAQVIEAIALNRVGSILAHFRPRRRNEGLEMLASGQRLVELLDARELAGVMFNLADALQGLGHPVSALRRYDYYLAYTERLYAEKDTDTRLQRWRLEWRLGRWATAVDHLSYLKGRASSTEGWLQYRSPYAIASAELDLGRPTSARAAMERHESALPVKLLLPLRAAAHRELLRAAECLDPLRADRYAAALIDSMTEASEYFYDVITPVLTALEWLVRRPSPGTTRRISLGLKVLEQVEHQYGSAESRAAINQAHAARAAASGACAAAACAYLRSAEAWKDASFPLDEARARSAAGRALLHAGDRRRGRAALARADRLMTTLAHQLPSDGLAEAFDRVRRAMLRQARAPGWEAAPGTLEP